MNYYAVVTLIYCSWKWTIFMFTFATQSMLMLNWKYIHSNTQIESISFSLDFCKSWVRCDVYKTWLWLEQKYIFIREPSKYKVLWSDKWHNSENVVFLKSRRWWMWYMPVNRYTHISAPGCWIWSAFPTSQSTGRAATFIHPQQHWHIWMSKLKFNDVM